MYATEMARDAVAVLVQRLQQCSLLSEDIKVSKWPPKAFVGELAPLLYAALERLDDHDCKRDRVAHIPAAVVFPCDLTGVFSTAYKRPQGAAPHEFCRTDGDIISRPYCLSDICIFHAQDAGMVEELVGQRGYYDLDALECVQVLAQANDASLPLLRMGFIRSLTSRDGGICIEGKDESEPVRIRVDLIARGVAAYPLSRSTALDFDYHVALCRKRIDPLRSSGQRLGTLRRITH
jgi:hypothetical protein